MRYLSPVFISLFMEYYYISIYFTYTIEAISTRIAIYTREVFICVSEVFLYAVIEQTGFTHIINLKQK